MIAKPFGIDYIYDRMYRLEAGNITKRFGSRVVLKDISFTLTQGESAAIVGPNGSGKSTLLLTLLHQYRPDNGKISYWEKETNLDSDQFRHQSVLVAPYFQMYRELTGEENLRFFLSISGCHITGKEINSALERVGLEGRGDDQIRTYSSGMLQRLRLAHAMLKRAPFIFLDEPFMNLDVDGKAIASALISEWRTNSAILIATNEPEEQALAKRTIDITR